MECPEKTSKPSRIVPPPEPLTPGAQLLKERCYRAQLERGEIPEEHGNGFWNNLASSRPIHKL